MNYKALIKINVTYDSYKFINYKKNGNNLLKAFMYDAL